MLSDPTLAVWLVLLGPCMGSFLAAFAERVCSGASLMAPSRCRSCGTALRWYELIPVVSWVALRGRCRHCGAAFGADLLAAEVAGGLLAVAALIAADTAGQEFAAVVWLWCLLGLCLTDGKCLRLPDPLTLALLASGLVLGAGGTLSGLAVAAATAAAGSAALWTLAALYRRLRGREGLGAGDVKMIAGIAAAVGPLGLPWVTLLAASGAIAAGLLRRGAPDRTAPQPFGIALALAGAAVWLVTAARVFSP